MGAVKNMTEKKNLIPYFSTVVGSPCFVYFTADDRQRPSCEVIILPPVPRTHFRDIVLGVIPSLNYNQQLSDAGAH